VACAAPDCHTTDPGRSESGRPDSEPAARWERIKKPVMLRVVLAKFGQDGELGRLRYGTG
jgi:predicted NAD-dependent protein-ADP-ribosyltransferase YbiA (DUF1768 family)